MCSLNDCSYDNDEPERARDSATDQITLCRKCRCKDIDVLLVGQSGYCKTCFLTATNHKFRAALGKSKIIRYGDSALVDHTGELNSTVLLHLIKAGMSESAHKRLIFKTVVLYVDDGIVTKKTNEERCSLRSKIVKQVKDSGFTGYVVSFSEALKTEADIDVKLVDHQEAENSNNENDDQLRTILTKLPDDTSRIDLLDQLRRKLLITAARKLNCNKIFLADSATDIATKVLANICLGRSAQLATLAHFCDARCTDVKILKPIRDFTQQELSYYSEYYKTESVKESSVPAPMSIQALAHNFTTGLESQFSGTISAIFRTAEKLSAKGNEEQDVENDCVLCDAKLDFASRSDEVSAMRAIEVSRSASSKRAVAKNLCSDTENEETDSPVRDKKCCNGNADCAKNDKRREASAEDIWKCLCYSCRLIFQHSDIRSTMPASLLFTIEQRLALRNMRKEISDFLL